MAATLIEIVHVIVAFFLILVVLVQGGNQGGVGAAFGGGGGNSTGVFGATGATSLLGKLTYGAAIVFMITSVSLTMLQGKGGDIGLKDRLKAAGAKPAAETTTTTPAAETAPQGQQAAPATAPADATPPAQGTPP